MLWWGVRNRTLLQKYVGILRQIEHTSIAGGVQDEPEVAKLLETANREVSTCMEAVRAKQLATLEVACSTHTIPPPSFSVCLHRLHHVLLPFRSPSLLVQVALSSLAEIVHRGSHTVTEVTRKRSQENSTRVSNQRAVDSEYKKLCELCATATAANVVVPPLDPVVERVRAALQREQQRQPTTTTTGAIQTHTRTYIHICIHTYTHPWAEGSLADTPEYASMGRLAVAVVRAVESIERARVTIESRHESHFGAAADQAAEVCVRDGAFRKRSRLKVSDAVTLRLVLCVGVARGCRMSGTASVYLAPSPT